MCIDGDSFVCAPKSANEKNIHGRNCTSLSIVLAYLTALLEGLCFCTALVLLLHVTRTSGSVKHATLGVGELMAHTRLCIWVCAHCGPDAYSCMLGCTRMC